MALAVLDQESQGLARELAQIGARRHDANRKMAEAQTRLTAVEERLAKLERARQSLDARRVDLRALVAEAGERLGATLAEARS